jgi:branched-chain amino acid aminotransferase
MIWVGGRVVPESELSVGVADRTFEHGLGLFETLRTWAGHPTLLARHRERMTRSARELGLPLDPAQLPDAAAVAMLRRAEQVEGDVRLRITLTGGTSDAGGSVAWMRSGPIPPPPPPDGARLGPSWTVCADDPLARHKGLNYWRRRIAYEAARVQGFDECLSATPDGLLWEGSRTNLFWVVGPTLRTPPRDGPLVPGVMRALVIERAARMGWEVVEVAADEPALRGADEVFLTNAVRGIIPVRTSEIRESAVPGPRTAELWSDVRGWLERGGTPS